MSERWLQVLGAGPWQLPVIRCAQALGLRVLAVDREPGRPGFELADRHALCDLMDAEGQTRLAREHRVQGVLQPTSDIGVAAAAAAAEDLGLPGPGRRAASLACDKGALFEAARAAGLAERRSERLQAGAPQPSWNGPCVVKPVDNQGGRGVSQVLRPQDLQAALQRAAANSRSGRLLVDEWLMGDEYILDGLVQRGQLHALGLARKRRDPDNPTVAVGIDYLVGAEREALLTRMMPPMQALIEQANWGSSLLHAELIDAPQGLQLIDLAARGGGAMIMSHALPALLEADIGELAVRLALGEPVQVPRTPRLAVCIEFLRCPPGRFEAFEGLEALREQPGIVAVHQAAKSGQMVGIALDKDARPGWLICIGSDLATARDEAERARRSLRVRLQGVDPSLALA
ncbi:MAG: ATP-grasp domain-containing protein [Burkholderiales bacterium]|nr:ATP-grasp domain-containing protein [Burkholderiales bacterium]